MHSFSSQYRRSNIVLFSLLILFCITGAPGRQWVKATTATQCSTITLTPITLPNATAGGSYSQSVTASGGTGNYTYSIFGGALTPGLTLTPSTGMISGTPTSLGNYTFTVRALDRNFCAGSRSYGIQVICPTITLGPIALYDPIQNRFVAAPIDLGPATDQVFVVFYGTGWKFRSMLSAVSCSIGGVSSEVLYAGETPGFAGLDQLNARLSRSLAGRGEVDVVISVDGKTANTVRVAIR